MPKLRDLCQQFWEEIVANSSASQPQRSPRDIADEAYEYLKANTPRDAEILYRNLLSIADEMKLSKLGYGDVPRLTEDLFG